MVRQPFFWCTRQIYAFDSGKTVDLFWGSANFSYSAMAGGEAVRVYVESNLFTAGVPPNRVSDALVVKPLPRGHRWVVVDASGEPPQFPDERLTIGPQVCFMLSSKEARSGSRQTSPGTLICSGKRKTPAASSKCMLKFTADGACLSKKVRDALGFGHDQAPRFPSGASARVVDGSRSRLTSSTPCR